MSLWRPKGKNRQILKVVQNYADFPEPENGCALRVEN